MAGIEIVHMIRKGQSDLRELGLSAADQFYVMLGLVRQKLAQRLKWSERSSSKN